MGDMILMRQAITLVEELLEDPELSPRICSGLEAVSNLIRAHSSVTQSTACELRPRAGTISGPIIRTAGASLSPCKHGADAGAAGGKTGALGASGSAGASATAALVALLKPGLRRRRHSHGVGAAVDEGQESESDSDQVGPMASSCRQNRGKVRASRFVLFWFARFPTILRGIRRVHFDIK